MELAFDADGEVANSISGEGELTVDAGNAKITLSGSNSYTGKTLINAGTLSIANQAALSDSSGSGGSYEIAGGAGLDLAFDESAEVENSIAGNGSLTVSAKEGVTITLSQENADFAGDTSINSGTLLLKNEEALGTSTNAVTVNNGGTLELGLGGSFTRSVAGDGVLAVDADGQTLTLSGDNQSFTGTTTVKTGTLKFASEQSVSNGGYAINAGASLVLDIVPDGGEFSNNLSGAGAVDVEAGSSTLTLSGTNSGFTGTTNVRSGSLRIGREQSLSAAQGSYNIAEYAALDLAFDADVEVANSITGEGEVTINAGEGVQVTLSGSNSYTGTTRINSGTLRLTNPEAVSNFGEDASPVATYAMFLAMPYSNETGYAYVLGEDAQLDLAFDVDAEFAKSVTGDGTVNVVMADGKTLTASGDMSTFTGTTNVQTGTFSLTDEQSLSGMATGNYGSYNLSTDASLDFAFAQNVDVYNSITGEGSVTVSVDPEAAVTLNGQNTYTGSTTVYSGTAEVAEGAGFASTELSLYSNATFKSNNNENINWKQISVYAEDGTPANYDGDLNATNAEFNFYGSADTDSALLHVTGDVNIADSSITVNLPGDAVLEEGSTYRLIEVDDETNTISISNTDGNIYAGSTIVSSYETIDGDGSFGFEVPSVIIGPTQARTESKVLLEGTLASLALINEGADLAAGAGMEAMHKTVRANQYSLTPFTAVQGSSLRYDTGSHIDLQSLTFLAGLGLGISIDDNSDLSLGIFAEFGDASYDTHNSFAGQGYSGKGSADYSLAGVMARYEYRLSQAYALYADASARLGHLHNSYHNNHLTYNGTAAGYSLSSTTYGFHLGAGIIMDLTDAVTLDLNAKYFYSKIDDASANLSTGESLYFDDLESKRLKLGGLLTFTLNSHVDILAGLTYEREFDGKAQGTTNGYDLLSPKLEGNTGIGRLGLSVRPNPQVPLTLELDVAGFTGQREGVTGTGMVRYEF